MRALLAIAVVLVGCVDPPRLRTCAEFPLGTSGCPSGCEIWCDLMLERCPSDVGPIEGDARTSCLSTCDERLTGKGGPGDLDGDTLECRITYAQRAQIDRAQCAAASLGGGGICSDATCERYCALMLDRCEGAYTSQEQCLLTCATFPIDPLGRDVDANTLECRARYAGLARDDENCSAAYITGGGVCGDRCAGYCDQVVAHCAGDAAIYSDRDECMHACAVFPNAGNYDDWQAEAPSVECRAYHASAPAVANAGLHCPHAAIYNDVHCGDRCTVYCTIVLESCPNSYPDAEACAQDCAGLDDNAVLFPFSDFVAPAACE